MKAERAGAGWYSVFSGDCEVNLKEAETVADECDGKRVQF